MCLGAFSSHWFVFLKALLNNVSNKTENASPQLKLLAGQ